MSSSPLTVEYDSMVDRHELYAKYGIAAEAAQLFETELGTLLLGLRGIENDWHVSPDPAAARKALDSIERSTLGRLLNDLSQSIQIDSDLADRFSSALQARNRLIHGFFEKHNFKIQTREGRTEMIKDLDGLHRELIWAWQAAATLASTVSGVVR
jgi:hypothetical protein